MKRNEHDRRQALIRLAGLGGAILLGGCDRLSQSTQFTRILQSAEHLTRSAQRAVAPRASMAQEFSEADLSPMFRSNGTSNPDNPAYQALAAKGFNEYRLKVSGLVQRPQSISLEELHSMPSRTQITRHDCVEGWSAIGKWTGTRLSALMERVGPQPDAHFVVFYCADPMEESGTRYYESISMEDAYHPQTILAYELNNRPLPIANGAPIRLRVERQLGYKMAKYVMAIELVSRFDRIGGGKGGYWEDLGYEWHAGI
jgi:DMSO/TMAO reductase YedYZ molybdopterin-dependent catalytic subunit